MAGGSHLSTLVEFHIGKVKRVIILRRNIFPSSQRVNGRGRPTVATGVASQ
jgi:hypothetical protein